MDDIKAHKNLQIFHYNAYLGHGMLTCMWYFSTAFVLFLVHENHKQKNREISGQSFFFVAEMYI